MTTTTRRADGPRECDAHGLPDAVRVRPGLVPGVCARCGVPAEEAVRVTVLDPVTHAYVAASLTLCPPAFITAATILHRRRAMRLPMCPADRADWEGRDRVTSWSYVFAV